MRMTCRTFPLSMLIFVLALTGLSGSARAQTFNDCTVGAATISLGEVGSFTLANQRVTGSGAGGLSCKTLATVAAISYIKVKLDATTFLLTSPAGQTIPFTLSTSPSGDEMAVGSEVDLSTVEVVSLFSASGSSIPLYVKTSQKAGLVPGTYTGNIMIRWYFSVCTLGVTTACLASSNSTGVSRGFTLMNWGSGIPVTVAISIKVAPDCQITAPDLAFGSAPLVGSFMPVSRTISVRCSVGSAYSVGLGNGQNYSSGRRMRQGTTNQYLKYEIYRGNSINSGRWGSDNNSERRQSTAADTNSGVYDSNTLQGYTYTAAVDIGQTTPSAGSYTDSIVVDIKF